MNEHQNSSRAGTAVALLATLLALACGMAAIVIAVLVVHNAIG